jgi:hypothetical protein
MELAKFLAGSDMVPKDYRDKPGNIVIAISLGHEIGLKWAQALQNIAVIGGRPTLWGDAGLGIVMSHPEYQWHREEDDAQTETATCTMKRRGLDPVVRSFSQADAERITVWESGRQVPLADRPVWKAGYKKRMRQMRARWWAMKDTFPDALKGVEGREYVEDDVTGKAVEVLPRPDEVMPRRREIPAEIPSGAPEGGQPDRAEPPRKTEERAAAAPPPPPARSEGAAPVAPQPGQLTFEINGRQVVTNGITKDTLLKAYKVGATLDELTQKGAAKDLLGREFGCAHRHELTELAGQRYVAELSKRTNQALAARR